MSKVTICRVSYRSRSGNVNELEEASICHAYGALHAAGIDTDVLDFYLDHELEIGDALKTGADLLLFYVRWPGEFWGENQKFIRQLRQLEGETKRLFAVFGETSVGHEKALHETPIDAIVTGEEPDLVQFVQAVLNGQDWRECSGIVYLQEDGTARFNQGLPLTHNLDDYKAKHYWLEHAKAKQLPLDFMKVAIRTARGCYARCNFCFITGYDNLYEDYGWRGRSAQSIFDEMKEVYETFGLTEFVFSDPTFIANNKASRQRALDLADLLIESGYEFNFLVYIRANDVDYELFSRLKQAGLYAVLMGLESFVPEKLKRYNKGTKVEQNKQALQIFKDLDLVMNLGFILFDKDTTLEELRTDLEGLKWLVADKPGLLPDPTSLIGSIFTPFEGARSEENYQTSQEEVERVLLNVVNDRLDQLDARVKYGFKNVMIAAMADAGWLFGREVGSQQYSKRSLQGRMISRLLADEEDEEAYDMALKIEEWRKELPRFAVHAFADVIEDLTVADDPEADRFLALEKAFEKFRRFNADFLGEEHAELRWYEDFAKIRDAKPMEIK